ncbi:MAG: glycosyltransferase family 2 protein [Candidatus Altiarchaeota archaeon]
MADYSVLIPVYNEADILEAKLRELSAYLDMACPDYEIIVCSNGSTDRTDEIGRGLREPRIRFISIPDRGVGRAFKRMVAEAKTAKLVSIDVDLTSDLNFIPQCVKLLDEFNIVIGSKNKGVQDRKWYRLFISGVFIALVRALLGLGHDDYSIGTKGWRRSDILGYVDGIDYGSSYVIELVYFVEKKDGKKVAETPVNCNDKRPSKFNLVHEIFYRFRNLVALWWRVKTG